MIDRAGLPAFEEIKAARFTYTYYGGPGESGIYFLFRRWVLLYVGQSVHIQNRLRGHRMKGYIPFDRVGVVLIDCGRRDLDSVEDHYIDLLQPRYNKRGHRDEQALRIREALTGRR